MTAFEPQRSSETLCEVSEQDCLNNNLISMNGKSRVLKSAVSAKACFRTAMLMVPGVLARIWNTGAHLESALR